MDRITVIPGFAPGVLRSLRCFRFSQERHGGFFVSGRIGEINTDQYQQSAEKLGGNGGLLEKSHSRTGGENWNEVEKD